MRAGEQSCEVQRGNGSKAGGDWGWGAPRSGGVMRRLNAPGPEMSFMRGA